MLFLICQIPYNITFFWTQSSIFHWFVTPYNVIFFQQQKNHSLFSQITYLKMDISPTKGGIVHVIAYKQLWTLNNR